MKTNKTWFAATLALVFLAGGLAGAFGGFSWARKAAPRNMQREQKPPPPPDFPEEPNNAEKAKMKERFKKMFLSRLDEELALNQEQQEKAGAIFDAQHEQVVAMRDEMRGRFQTIEGRTIMQIREILDTRQQEKLDALVKEYKARNKGDKFMPLLMRPRDESRKDRHGRFRDKIRNK